MTQGRAHHSQKFIGYEPVPPDQAKQIIAEARKDEQ
jgi:translation elongation factor EF-G